MNRAMIVAAALGTALVLSVALPRGTGPVASAEEGATYVGSDTCKKCHFKQHRAWKKTGLAKSLETLKPTTADGDKELFDKKTAAKLDPAKDYSTDATCLACHTTGYGKTGGYPADPAASDEAKAAAEAMGSIGCEACHGPGSKYSEFKTAEVAKDKDAKFEFDKMAPYGLVMPDEALCTTCHNDKNPTNATDDFKFAESKDKVHPGKK